jgi:hypothetical protein
MGLLGYGLLFVLFPRTSPTARWHHQLDRATAIAKAREAAAWAGLEVREWNVLVSARGDTALVRYLDQNATPISGAWLTPVLTSVLLADYRSGRRFRADLNARGELIGFQVSTVAKDSGKDSGKEAPPRLIKPTEAELARDRQIAEQALERQFGGWRGVFSAPPSHAVEKKATRFTWSAADDRMKLVSEALVSDGVATELKLTPTATQKFQAELDARESLAFKLLDGSENLIFWPSLIVVAILYFIGLARRRINHRRTLIFFALSLLALLLGNGFGGFYNDLRRGTNFSGVNSNYWIETLVPPLVFGLTMLIFAGFAYVYFAAGTAQSGSLPHRRTVDIELGLRGRLLTRPVVESLAAGLLAAGLLAAAPHLVMAPGWFPASSLGSQDFTELITARSPLAATLFGGMQFAFIMVFAFAAQLVDAWVKPGVRAWTLTFLLAVLGFGGAATPFRFSFLPALLCTLLMAAILTWLYYRFGLLSVLFATVAAQIATGAAGLLAQPASALQGAGWRLIATLGALALAAMLGFARARGATERELAPEISDVDTRAERERLQAEFDVARRAQEQMLPDAPPHVPGLQIAAVCCPSKEVGGDLYDFLPLRDGKLGIVVADVSGKGVPASLYMTLTKGLLASVSEERSDPGEILREVNRHLYDVCRRKMFVTLFLGVIDPATRTLTYARAGHNPTVFRSPSENRTTLLKSRGMGLGLNRGKLFDQSLRVESVSLQSRDKLFFYSDGITEAMNAGNEEYGEQRLMDLAANSDEWNAEASRDAILADVRNFLGANPPQDDQTLVVVQVV